MATLSQQYKMTSTKSMVPSNRLQSPIAHKYHQHQNGVNIFKNQIQQAVKTTTVNNFHKKPVPSQPFLPQSIPLTSPKNNGLRPTHYMLSPQMKTQVDGNRGRPLSSHKQENKPKRISHRKGNMFRQIPQEKDKFLDTKESTSKKSTDNSNSTQIEKVKAQNKEIKVIIRAEQKKLSQLQKQIKQEQRKHQAQRQIYQLNIDKLKKKAGSNQALLSRIGEGTSYEDNQQDDYLSIESH